MIFVSETQFHVYLFSTNFMYACLAQCHSVLIINRFLNSSKFAKVRFQLLCSDEERDQSLGRVNEFEECSLSLSAAGRGTVAVAGLTPHLHLHAHEMWNEPRTRETHSSRKQTTHTQQENRK